MTPVLLSTASERVNREFPHSRVGRLGCLGRRGAPALGGSSREPPPVGVWGFRGVGLRWRTSSGRVVCGRRR
jgi:hypothetical protein